MRLREVMSDRVVTVAPEDTASLAWSRMQRHGIRHLAVVQENGDLVGVLSDRDLGGQNGASVRRGRKVEELMTSRYASAKTSTTLREAANLMRSQRIGSLPVFEGDELVGIVTATDVLDELGRGSTRPAVQATRRTLRLPTGKHQRGGRPVVRRPSGARTKAGRARARKPDSAKRAPFPREVPKASKRPSAKKAPPAPAHIRVFGTELGPDDRAYARRKLGMKLGKFADSIERVSLRVRDVNGPRGGVDHTCQIKAVLSGLPSVVYESRAATATAALDDAIAGIERAVRQAIGRRRTRPLRGGGTEQRAAA
jgi:CBS domain-containing protein